MQVYVKETLHVLDYKDNIVDTIFISDDHRTAGYAYDITITEANTGYSDLNFNMPNTIISDNGGQIKNPKLLLLKPLTKLRYHREVIYTGDKEITVREPIGYGDTITYRDVTYSNKYPNNIIEDYIMDYIIQPVDKSRKVLEIATKFTAMDYPRFNLSKKRVGLNISQDTLTREEWSLFKNEPMDQPGTIKYIKWTDALSNSVKLPDQQIPIVWDPEHATEYPLTKENITDLMNDVAQWSYGLLATAFYWPIVSTGRYKGVMYKEGGYLVLHVYDFYNLSTEGVDEDRHIGRYAWDWTQLYEVDSYLCPNRADNYLHHILEGTNWTVAKREDGTDDVDIVQSEIPNPKGSTTSTTLADDTCNISVSGSNCYNAITAVCQGLQLYPIYDCVNRTVALRAFVGKNYGLTYSLGNNIASTSTKADGEKVITKLYVTGGKDYNGDANINIGYSERSYLKTFTGFYSKASDLPTTDVEGYWAIVDPKFTDTDFQVTEYNRDMSEKTVITHDTRVKNYWESGPNRQVYFYTNGTWVLGTKETTGLWSGQVLGQEVVVDPTTGTQAPWDPNDSMYILSRSPYGTNYILNFRWYYDNGWMTKEQILELYQYELAIHNLDYMFMDGYTQDRLATQQDYHDAANNYDIEQDGYESTLYAMESKYYKVDGDYSEGTQYCFHVAPQGTYTKFNTDLGKTTHYIKLFHCYDCGWTQGITPNGNNTGANITVCPKCGKSSDVVNNEIYIPTYNDYEDVWEYNGSLYPEEEYEGYAYNPHLKGYFLRLVTALDRRNKDWDIGDYERRISMIEPIRGVSKEDSIDGYDYQIEGVYVRATSGQIEVWNECVDPNNKESYIYHYGCMLDYHRKVEACLKRIEELQELYDKWSDTRDQYHATIQEKFGDYLIEGNYTNNEQPYDGLLFQEGMEASDKYSIPEITYNLDVIDSSGLIEYRQPTITKYECGDCGYISYHTMRSCPKCGEDNILVINDTYNTLVHMLHSVGQIIPKAGDYVSIYDEPVGIYGLPGLITEISRYLDNPVKNKIKIDTSYTDDEELVGNIITATNTVLSNADIYARTAVLKGDGTIDSNSLAQSTDNPNANISIVGTNGNVLLSGSGLRCTDPSDPTRAMKYTGAGIFNTTNFSTDSGEGVIWEKMITPSGINATYINAGTIDTNKLTIMSGLSSKVIMDQYGLAVKDRASKSHHVEPFDKTLAAKDASYAKSWGEGNNIASFIGVDTNNDPLIYTRGYLYAEEGSNIAGWVTSKDGFYHLKDGTTNSTKDLWLSSNGISGTVNNVTDKFAYYANGNFGVTTSGTLYAKNANIQGHIEAYDGTIGRFTLNQNRLYSGSGNTTAGMGVYGADMAFWAGSETSGVAPFRVGHDGSLYASSATIAGAITASSGTFSNCRITDSCTIECPIRGSLVTSGISASNITTGTLSANFISGGTISGSHIHLNGGTVKLCTGGHVEFTNDIGFFTMGPASSDSNAVACINPYVSALNVACNGDQGGGISLRSGQNITSSGDELGGLRVTALGNVQLTSENTINIIAENGMALQAVHNHVAIRNDKNELCFDGHKIIGANYNASNPTRPSTYSQITIYQNMYLETMDASHACYYGPKGTSFNTTHEIATKGFTPSTLSVKENVRKKDTSKILDIFANMDLYDYKYIDEVNNGREEYGYIIDYMEKIPGIEKFIDFIPTEVDGHDTKRIIGEQFTKFLLGGVIQLAKEIKRLKKED